MRTLNNSLACLSWLNYLNKEQHAEALLGPITPELKAVSEAYDIPNYNISYGAEVQLLGNAGVDLSVQYYGADFLYNNPLGNKALKPAGEKFSNYARALNTNLPDLINHCRFYLEADTASGSIDEYALFFTIAGTAADELLSSLLTDNNAEHHIETVKKILTQVNSKLELFLIGFMNSREKKPLRLVFVNPENDVEQFIQGMKQIFPTLPADLEDKLTELANLQLFNFMLNIDVMPDGSFGDTIGIDALFDSILPKEQEFISKSSQYEKTISLLKAWNLADERVDTLSKCIQLLTINTQEDTYQLLSALSHFKLRWKDGNLLPAKAYIWLKFDK